MLTEHLTDQQFLCLIAGIISLAIAGLLIVIIWPLGDAPGLSDAPQAGYSVDQLDRMTRAPPAFDPLRRSIAKRAPLT